MPTDIPRLRRAKHCLYFQKRGCFFFLREKLPSLFLVRHLHNTGGTLEGEKAAVTHRGVIDLR